MEIITELRQTHARMDRIVAAAGKVKEGIAEIWDALSTSQVSAPTPSGKPSGTLSKKQLAVYALLAQGLDVHAIAKKLGLSVRTVQAHRNTVRIRLKFKTVSELDEYAKKNPEG